jgi:hypothetical protein
MKIYRPLLLVLLLLAGTKTFAQTDTTKPVKLTGFDREKQFALSLGAGTSSFKVTNSNWKQGPINYNDSLRSITRKSVFKFDLSILYLINFNKSVSFRPAIALSFEGGKIQYSKQQSVETLNLSTTSVMLSSPFLFKFRTKSIQPYLALGPGFLYMLRQDEKAEKLLPLKTFDLLADAGLGVDIDVPRLKLIVTPEVKFSTGLLNQKGTANNLYANTVEQLKRQAFTFTVYLRDR